MSRIVDIQLYRSYKKSGALKATGIRKVFTSMLVVLLVIAAGIGIYFHYSSMIQQAAVVERPPKPKPKVYSLSQQVSNNLLRWGVFSKNIFDKSRLVFQPEIVLSDKEPFFLADFVIPDWTYAESLMSAVGKVGRIITIIDTASSGDGFRVIVRGRIPRAMGTVQLMPVRKYLRATVMNFLDSLARAQGLSVLNRVGVSGDIRVKGGTVFKFRQTLAGEPSQFGLFASKVKELKYAVSPSSFMYDLTKSPPVFDIVWGLYDYQQKPAGQKPQQTARK